MKSLYKAFWLSRQLTQALSVSLTLCASAIGASAIAAIITRSSIMTCRSSTSCCATCCDAAPLRTFAAFAEAPTEEECKLLHQLS